VHDDLTLDLPLCEEMCKDAVSDFLNGKSFGKIFLLKKDEE